MFKAGNGLLTSYHHYVIADGSNEPKEFKNHFTLQIYTASELQAMLRSCGFEILGQFGMDESKFIDGETLNILTVARKI